MPNPPEQQLIPYLTELKDVRDHFVKTINVTQSLLIILNSGGVIALASFFTDQGTPDLTIKLASVLFIFGIILALLTLFCDFFIGYFLFNNLLKISSRPEIIDEYNSDKQVRANKLQSILILLIALGVLSLIFWLLGVCFILGYILDLHCKLLVGAVIFLSVFIFGIFLFYGLKSKVGWQSKENQTN